MLCLSQKSQKLAVLRLELRETQQIPLSTLPPWPIYWQQEEVGKDGVSVFENGSGDSGGGAGEGDSGAGWFGHVVTLLCINWKDAH